MNCVPSWRRRAAPSCRPEANRGSLVVALALAPSLALLTGCAGLFQRSIPAEPAACVHVATGPLSVGFAEADITPDDSQYLAGFTPKKPSTGIHSRLKARVMVLVVGDRRVAIIGVDSLGLMREDVDWIKRGLTGFANGDVFLCASHTHAAPDLIGIWGVTLLTSGRDVDYLKTVCHGIRDAVAKASKAVKPATLWLGETRLPRDGLVGNSNRKGVFNQRVTVLNARDRETGDSLGALLHFACHPEMMRRDNTLVSADMVGELCDQWRGAGHGQAVFVNGELGAMVTPRYRPRGAKGTPGVGRELLARCERALAASQRLDPRDLEVRRRDVYMPLESPGLILGRLTGTIRRELYSGRLRTSVGYLRIGEFEAVSVPGEIEPVFAEEIRRELGRPRLVVFGLVDDEVGYLMRGIDAVDPEFQYEREVSPGRTAGELVRAALAGR